MNAEITITKAIIRASKHQVGAKELPVLLLSRDGVTSDKIAQILGLDKELAKGRISMLVGKRLIERVTAWGAPAVYKPTQSGKRIIESVFESGGDVAPEGLPPSACSSSLIQ